MSTETTDIIDFSPASNRDRSSERYPRPAAAGAGKRAEELSRACLSRPILGRRGGGTLCRRGIRRRRSMTSRPQPGSILPKLASAADRLELVDALKAEIERGQDAGPVWRLSGRTALSRGQGRPDLSRCAETVSASLARRLAAALEHAHLLVFRPRDAAPAAMQALLDAGWSTTGIVTFSQLVAFLSFQVRAVAGLRTLGASLGHQPCAAKAS